MKVLKKRIGRLEKDGGDACPGCAELFARRSIYLANLPDPVEPVFFEDDPIWVENWLRSQDAREEDRRRQADPDWRKLPEELELAACTTCGATIPHVTLDSLQRLRERARG